MAEEVSARLESELPPHLTYHSAAHTRYVLEKTAFLADKESVFGRERLLLFLAALYHDCGFLVSSNAHELRSCEMAREGLGAEGMPDAELDVVCTSIMATAIPQKPESLSGAILADADLFYLGTDDYDFYADKLFRELRYFRPEFSKSEWLEMQINFLRNHSYHTDYCKESAEAAKQEHLVKLLKLANR